MCRLGKPVSYKSSISSLQEKDLRQSYEMCALSQNTNKKHKNLGIKGARKIFSLLPGRVTMQYVVDNPAEFSTPAKTKMRFNLQ